MRYSLPVLKLYLSEFGDPRSREDTRALLSKAQIVAIDLEKFSKKASGEGCPWATYLVVELLSGFAEKGERRAVFVYYRLLEGVIETSFLIRSTGSSLGPITN